MSLNEKEALDACAAEPIHIPGAIQSSGYLLATDPGTKRFTRLSLNCAELWSRRLEALSDQSPRALLGEELLHGVRNVLSRDRAEHEPHHAGSLRVEEVVYDVSVHRSSDEVVIELRPLAPRGDTEARSFDALNRLFASLDRPSSLDALLNEAVRGLRDAARFDRVMAYRFLPDDSGEVLAEDCAHYAESFLGLRYPASDIPAQARRLYLRTPIRLIDDVEDPGVPVSCPQAGAAPLDLSSAILRACSPIHLQYLRNMGVASSMTLPLVIGGELWGLLACHHLSVRKLPPALASACRLVGRLVSSQLEACLGTVDRNVREAIDAGARQVAATQELFSAETLWRQLGPTLSKLLPSEGVAISLNGESAGEGLRPSSEVLGVLEQAAQLRKLSVTAWDQLSDEFPDLDLEIQAADEKATLAGSLVIQVSVSPPISIHYFRQALAQVVRWGGAPEKKLVVTDEGTRLMPRASFEEYLEHTSERCDPWTPGELGYARALAKAVAQALDLTFTARETGERMSLLVHELNHRVRNILALVQSVIAQSPSVASLEDYRKSLEARVMALASAHDLLTANVAHGLALKDLVATELAPYGPRVILVEGEDAILSPASVPLLTLVIHELASNAAKYGALSVAQGQVEVRWTTQSDGCLIAWQEHRGPPVSPPTRKGLGRTLLERAVPFELDGEVELVFAPTGVRASIFIPMAAFEARPHQSSVEPLATETRPPRLLVVEDSFLVARQVEAALKEAFGAEVVMAATVRKALKAIDEGTFDAAILDVNLRGELSVPIAERLTQIGTPFIFTSGYGDRSSLPPGYAHRTLLTKPVQPTTLLAAVEVAMNEGPHR